MSSSSSSASSPNPHVAPSASRCASFDAARSRPTQLYLDWARPLPHLRRDMAHPAHICAGTELTRSAHPETGSDRQHSTATGWGVRPCGSDRIGSDWIGLDRMGSARLTRSPSLPAACAMPTPRALRGAPSPAAKHRASAGSSDRWGSQHCRRMGRELSHTSRSLLKPARGTLTKQMGSPQRRSRGT